MRSSSSWFPFPYVLAIAILLTAILSIKHYMLSATFIEHKPPFDPGYHILHPFINFGFWAFLSPLVWQVVQKCRPDQSFNYTKLLSWILAGIGLAAAHEFITTSLYFTVVYLLGNLVIEEGFYSERVYGLLGGFFSRFMEYWVLFFGLTIWGYYQAFKKQKLKLAQLKAELFETKLEALKAQLHPHFLFNTLNTVSALMTKDIQLAQKVLSNLAQLLRTLFKHDGDHLVSLSEELEFIRNYLEIEQIRFSDRLRVRYQIDPGTQNALVPRLILQPLVENSLKHGISKNSLGGEILVSAAKSNGSLELAVCDNGKGVADTELSSPSNGVGLTNTRERLEQLYQQEMTMTIESVASGGFKVNLIIPFELN